MPSYLGTWSLWVWSQTWFMSDGGWFIISLWRPLFQLSLFSAFFLSLFLKWSVSAGGVRQLLQRKGVKQTSTDDLNICPLNDEGATARLKTRTASVYAIARENQLDSVFFVKSFSKCIHFKCFTPAIPLART